MISRQIFWFCESTGVFFISLSRRIQSLDSWRNGRHITACNEWAPNIRHNLGSEMPVRTVRQKFIRPQWREDFQRIMGQTNKDCRFRNFTLVSSPHQQHLLVGRYCSKLRCVLLHNFRRKLCYGSKMWRWLNQWMISNLRLPLKELLGQTFELLDARIASTLNKIIQNTRFKKKVSLEEMKAHKEDRFLRGRQIAYLIYEYFLVTGANDSIEN